MLNDPFGEAIADYFEGNKKASIVVNSSITEKESLKASKLFRTIRSMTEIEKTALELCNGAILDVGAGSGTHALILQKNKKNVTALDLSQKACDVMSKRGVKQVIKADIFEYKTQQFDSILLLMNGIGIAGTLDGLDALLEHMNKILVNGGKIYLESTDIMYMFVEEDGSMLIDLNGAYYGELTYDISYNEHKANFPWLFVDYGTLETHAIEKGYHCEIVTNDENYSYLACLTKAING